VKSIRRGGTDSPLAASPNQPRAGASDPGDTSKEKPLSYVFVRFEKAIRGNLKTRETTFSDQVRTVYSPVRDWNAEVDDDPRKLDPRGVLLTSDRLTLRQMQAVSRKEPDWIEIEAAGNAIAEAPTFTARAHSMKYTQAKDLLILDGENVTDAVLSRQTQVGGRISSVAAGKILYWRSEPRVEVDRFRYGDLSQIGRSPGE
jgi:hypothetical protein